MDAERCRFLFGSDEPPVDPDSEEELVDWFSARAPEGPRLGGTLRGVVARQILSDDPPEVWTTAQRLNSLGLDRDAVLEELTRVLMASFARVMNPEYEPDGRGGESLRRMLDALPSPTDEEAVGALTAAAAAGPARARDEVIAAALTSLGRAVDDELAQPLLDALVDDLVEEGELVELAGGRLVHLPSIVRNRCFTHRLSPTSVERSWLWSVAGDLDPLLAIPEVRTVSGDTIERVEAGLGFGVWQGPEGWLRSSGHDEIASVRVDDDGVVTVETVGETEPDEEMLALVRRVATEELADADLPIPITNIAAALLLADPRAFSEPTAPLSELVRRAGFDARAGRVARDDEAWHAAAREERHDRLHDASDDEDAVHTAMDVLDTFDEELARDEHLRAALHDLDDPDVLGLVLEEILGQVADGDQEAEPLATRLVGAARRPRDLAIAHLIGARMAQTLGDGPGADEHARAAVRADPTFGPATDVAAYFASVRGDAATAARLWRTLENPDPDDLKGVVPFLYESSPKLGRNDPCWCGSGRKFKSCHQGKVEQAALPDRVGWLCNKAAGFLRRAGSDGRRDFVDLLRERALDPDDRTSIIEAAGDPVVVDAALTEGGWFARFLETMRGVLPDDEELLAESWLLVDRTVYEFEEVHSGRAIDVRDISTGERFAVRERTLSRTAQPGSFWCARAVPDGETAQLVGAVVPVAPGREADVLALCERKDPYELCSWVRNLHAPPTLTTREGEPLVQCVARVRAPDASAAQAVLDSKYERDGDGWTELFDIGGGERIVRGQLSMTEDAVIEISTSSEVRMDRIESALLDALPGAVVVSDEREPLNPEKLAGRQVSSAARPVRLTEEDRERLLQMMEQRWMTEPVPALGGVTPQEAMADPTRRDSVRRLLATFPESDDPDALLLRPSRIRSELGL